MQDFPCLRFPYSQPNLFKITNLSTKLADNLVFISLFLDLTFHTAPA